MLTPPVLASLDLNSNLPIDSPIATLTSVDVNLIIPPVVDDNSKFVAGLAVPIPNLVQSNTRLV